MKMYNEFIIKYNIIKKLAMSSVEGDFMIGDRIKRIHSWSFWCLNNIVKINNGSREYIALMLPGDFYLVNPSLSIKPHIEIKKETLESEIEFPLIISSAGNSLMSKYWVYNEVRSIRDIINKIKTSELIFLEELEKYRDTIIENILIARKNSEEYWDSLTVSIASSADDIFENIYKDILVNDIFKNIDKDRNIIIKQSKKQIDLDGTDSIKRLGIWEIWNQNKIVSFCVTPRLTRNSQFYNNIKTESTISLLVTSILLYRIINFYDKFTNNYYKLPKSNGYLMKLSAKYGKKIPEASLSSCINFIQRYNVDQAFEEINNVLEKDDFLLVSKESFYENFLLAKQKIGRLEDISQEEINIILPLAISKDKSLFRLSYGEK